MPELTDQLAQVAADATSLAARLATEGLQSTIEQLESAVETAAKAWSGSWLGYHSRIYYQNLEPVPPGARFDQLRGLQDSFSSDTRGDWAEYSFDAVYDVLKRNVPESDFDSLVEAANDSGPKVRELSENLLSILESIAEVSGDTYLTRLVDNVKEISPISATEVVNYLRPSGKFMSLDTVAIQDGLQTPPHIALLAQIKAMQSPFTVADNLAKLAKRAERHIVTRRRIPRREVAGTSVFIGHGRATQWRELKDFIQDRLALPWDEFNRVPIAGVTNIARLSEMLNEAAIAFLVMTAEDEQLDGTKHARMNVIHEAGLFQGRLGFGKAIIVLEEGCEEFSNIQGLGQIRFPAGNIKACFEEIRQVLERESLLES